ncbi:hypothetical protein EIG88_16235, partial [Staphylococcus aureus]
KKKQARNLRKLYAHVYRKHYLASNN